ncbi:hypothetical protein SFC88_00660 [Nocardioides sp. HM23]|uniref:hypothetical protein n=1 Tax=Nocardioides bizhenqiangii TaxID=3095076 RepID=UPI002ACACBB8|nr:hypothetical protein [Nocardioides sp. HM23]MDZ5619314.1 hypothetical protein [Nocardioides sp. HM23]
MNTRHQTRWTVALAAVVLTLTAACGADSTAVPADIDGPERDRSTDTWHDDNPARLDFRDNGLG